MTQNRGAPTANVRTGDDFEWVNSWAEASGFKAARDYAAEPVKPAATASIKTVASTAATAPQTEPTAAAQPAVDERDIAFPIAPDQLARDVAEIETARDALIAAEETGPFALSARRTGRGLVRRQDAVPVIIGAMLAMFMLVVYGAVASILAFGR